LPSAEEDDAHGGSHKDGAAPALSVEATPPYYPMLREVRARFGFICF
jgi:hypothetical protein